MPQPSINFTVSEILPGQILKVKVTTAISNVKSRSHHDVAYLQPQINILPTYQLTTPYSCRDIAQTRYRSRFIMARPKVKSRSHHDVAHAQPLTNVPTNYQLPTHYGFHDTARTRFYKSMSLQQGQIKVTPCCCTSTTTNQCPYQVSTSYTLRFP